MAKGIEYERCPQFLIRQTPEVTYYLRLFKFYDKGFLPFPGSILDQPGIMMEAFDVIESINAEKAIASAKSSSN